MDKKNILLDWRVGDLTIQKFCDVDAIDFYIFITVA